MKKYTGLYIHSTVSDGSYTLAKIIENLKRLPIREKGR